MRPIPGSTVSQRVAQRDRPNSGFDRLRNRFQLPLRGLQSHNVHWLAPCPFEIVSWPRSTSRYPMGNFNSGWPYDRDYLAARRTLLPLIGLWDYDQLCLYANRG